VEQRLDCFTGTRPTGTKKYSKKGAHNEQSN